MLQELFIANGEDLHNLWPPNMNTLIGMLLLASVTLLSAIAGLGGGAITLPILMTFFNYSPKQASIVCFCAILGGSIGNAWNFYTKFENGKPIINYEYLYISIPFMFVGAQLGVIINKVFPGITICVIGVYLFYTTSGKVYNKFRQQYEKQNIQNKQKADEPQKDSRQMFNPKTEFKRDSRTIHIIQNMLILTIITAFLTLGRGSEKYPSIIGIQPCSVLYWLFFGLSFGILLAYAFRNVHTFRLWYQEKSSKTISKQSINTILKNSVIAGILSGFGIGGGMILVPMYRNIGLKPLETSATCAFGICLTAIINCIQGISIGMITVKQMIYFIVILSILTFKLSTLISTQLKRRNRMSYVTGLFFLFLCIGMVNIPTSIYNKYIQSGYNLDVLIGFGSIC